VRAAALAAAVLLAACGPHEDRTRSDWEEANAARFAKEGQDVPAQLPPAPGRGDLLGFRAGPTSEFDFYVDARSLAVSEGVVRYVLVARSPSGAQNVSFEAISCRSGEYRLYATGGPDGGWQRQESPWRSIGLRNVAQRVLMREYFCPKRIAIASGAEGVMALQRGGHPLADAPDPVSGGSR
jgi:hypothetical protein